MQSIKDKQPSGRNTAKHQAAFQKRRNNQTRDHMSKGAQKMIQYCIQKEVGTLIIGYNNMFQQSWSADEYLNDESPDSFTRFSKSEKQSCINASFPDVLVHFQ